MKFECKIGCDGNSGPRVQNVEDVCRALSAIIAELLRKDVRESKEGENNVFVGDEYVGWYAFGNFVQGTEAAYKDGSPLSDTCNPMCEEHAPTERPDPTCDACVRAKNEKNHR